MNDIEEHFRSETRKVIFEIIGIIINLSYHGVIIFSLYRLRHLIWSGQ